jgi:sugar phosphate isomerase/epimerase
VWSIGSPLGKAEITVDFNEYAEKVKKVCETANIFGTDKIRMFSFFNAYNEKNKVIDYLSKMVEIGNSFGVKMCHENEKEVYGDTLFRVQEIRKNVRGWKFIYDPANFVQVGEIADETLAALHSTTDYFHIKDVIAETDELVPAGCGDGKIDELIARIVDDKVLTLEPHLAVFDAFATIDNTEMKHRYHFKDNAEAFDTAVKAVKDLLAKAGYKEIDGGFIK